MSSVYIQDMELLVFCYLNQTCDTIFTKLLSYHLHIVPKTININFFFTLIDLLVIFNEAINWTYYMHLVLTLKC